MKALAQSLLVLVVLAAWQGTAVIGENTTLTIFGRIFGGQNAHVGSYGDTIVVTITY